MNHNKTGLTQLIESLVRGAVLLLNAAAFLLDLERGRLWRLLLPTPRGRSRNSWHILPGLFLIALPAFGQTPDTTRQAVERKIQRDMALSEVGQQALPFTKQFGDLGVQALRRCKPETGRRIVAAFESGEMRKLPNVNAALETICQHGDPVAAWMLNHLSEIAEPDAFGVFCGAPLEFVYDLKDLQQQVGMLRERRMKEGQLPIPASMQEAVQGWTWQAWAIAGALVLVVLGFIQSRFRGKQGVAGG